MKFPGVVYKYSVFLLIFVFIVSLPLQSRAGFGEFTIKEEAELGEKFSRMIRTRFSLIEDPVITGYVRDVVQKIFKEMPPQPFSIKPHIIDDNSMNAFATVAGYMFVFSGLILKVDHEAELAAVIAHELGHISQRHVAHHIERAQWASLGSLLGVLAGVFVGSSGSGEASQALMAGSMAGSQSALLKYTREDERQADQVGLSFLVDAGYKPQAVLSVFEKIRKAHRLGGSSFPSYLSTHPAVGERLGYLEDRIKRLPRKIRDRNYNDQRLHRVQMLLRARYSNPETAMHYFRDEQISSGLKELGLGIALSRQNRIEKAQQAFSRALTGKEDESLFLREAGRFYYSYGDLDKAAKYLQKAVFLSPRDVIALFYYARVLEEQKKYKEAISFLKQVVEKLPEDAEVRRELGKAYGQLGDMFQAHLQMAYSFMYANKKSNIGFHLKKMQKLAQGESEEKKVETFKKKYEKRSKFW